jgi:hypothetical protein
MGYSMMVRLDRSEMEVHRAKWHRTAMQYGWGQSPQPVQYFISRGRIVDSVAYASLASDLVTDSRGRDVAYTVDEDR